MSELLEVLNRQALSPAYTLDRSGLTIRDDLPLDECLALGERLCATAKICMFLIGDWLLHMGQRFPEHYEDAAIRTGLEHQTLKNAKWVAKAIPVSRRRQGLAFSHHQEVARLSHDLQDRWLTIAEKEGLSQKQLRASIRHGKMLTPNELKLKAEAKARDKGQPNIFAALVYVQAEIAQLEQDKGPANTWKPRQKEIMLEAFEVVENFVERLRA